MRARVAGLASSKSAEPPYLAVTTFAPHIAAGDRGPGVMTVRIAASGVMPPGGVQRRHRFPGVVVAALDLDQDGRDGIGDVAEVL